MPKNNLMLAVFSLFGAMLLWAIGLNPSHAYTYNNYTVDDLAVTNSSTTAGASNNLTVTFTVPDDMSSGLSTGGSLSLSTPYLYRYSGGSYTSDYLDIGSATISSSQLTVNSQSSNYVSFTPKAALTAGATVTITITGAVNPEGIEGTGSFSIYGSEYSSSGSYYNWFWGSVSQAFGEVDYTVTMYDADGTTPVSNVSVGLYYYNSSNYSDYEYHSGYTNSSGQVQFAGLTSGRTYTMNFYYSGTTTNNDPPVGQTYTFSGTALSQSFNFAAANVSTHYKDVNGNAINNAYWYFYKTDYTNYTTDYLWRSGTTDSAGLIIGAAQLDGSYTLSVQDPNTYNYDTFTFTVSGGVVSGLSDPIQQTGPEVSGTVTAGGTAVSNAYVYIHDSNWSNYKYDYTDSSGNFSFDLTTAGTYSLEVSSYGLPSGYFAPDVQSVSVTPGTSNASVSLALEAATKTISGTVKKKNGDNITDASIYAYQSAGSYRYASTTVSNGQFSLPVSGGNWNVYIYQNQWPATWAYTGRSMVVEFASNATAETATLAVQVSGYNSHFTGRILKPDGTAVGANDVYVYAYGGENNSVYAYDYSDANGEIDIAVTDGTFSLYFYFYSSGANNLSFPATGNKTVEENGTTDLGDIQLVEKEGHIQGHITISDTGEAVANQYVYAYRQDGTWEWAQATTDSKGFFDLLVSGPAKWTVYTYAAGLTTSTGQSIIYSGGNITVNLGEPDETVTGQDFIFDVADATASFTVQDADSNAMTDQYGWVSLSTDTDDDDGYGWSYTGCYVDRGSCSVPASSDVEYTVDYYPYNWYRSTDETSYSYSHLTVDGVQATTVELDGDETQAIVLVMAENNSSITGSFVDEDGNAVSVTGYVYASGGDSRWASAYIDDSSSYTLKVAPGDYDVSYWVYGDWQSSYKKSKEVSVSDGETESLDLTVFSANATISGVVLDPDGDAVTSPVFVQASTSYGTEHTDTEDNYGLISQTTYTDAAGQFTMDVPKGKYYLTASSPDYLAPQPVKVTADTVGSGKNVTLAFVKAGSTITGIVTDGVGITVNAQRTQATGDVVSDAFVYGYCIGGSYTDTETDAAGQYALNVPADDTCYVGGVYQTEGMAYYSKQVKVKTKKATVEQDLALDQSLDVPEAQTAKFNPREGAVVELENGVRVEIPANAITADESVNEVTVVVTALAEAVHQPGTEPISLVYKLTATDADGNPISQFAGDVKIIIPYNSEELDDVGTDEDSIQTNYYEDAAGTWQPVDGGVIKNKDEDQFEISVQHFSVFGIVASRSLAQEDAETGEEGEEESSNETTVETGILGIPGKVKVKKGANNSIVVTWKKVGNAERYQVKLSTSKKTIDKAKTNKHRLKFKKLNAKKTYRVQVRSLGTTGSKSGWSTRVKVKLSGNKKTSVLLQRAELLN